MLELKRVKQFSETSPELYSAMKTYHEHCMAESGRGGKTNTKHSKADMEKAINKMFSEEIEKKSGVTVSQYDGSLQRYANNTQVKEFANAIRDFMIDMILPDTLLNGILPYFADIRFAGLGESMTFDIANNSLYYVSKAGYRKRSTNLQQLFGTSVTLVPENRMVTVGTDLFSILTNRQFIATEVMKAARSIETAMLFDGYDTFNTTMGGLTGNLLVSNYSETSLIKLCETVGSYNQSMKPIIMGTPVALKSVLPTVSNNFRYTLDSDYVKMGYIQDFNGYDVIPMPQVANPYAASQYSMKLDDTRIYVVSPASDKLIKIGVGGDLVSHTDSVYDNANLMQLTTLSKAWDTQACTNSVAGIVTNIA